MNNFIKKISFLSISIIAAINFSLSAFADNSSTAPAERSFENSAITSDISSSADDNNFSKAETTGNILQGNADLIKEQKIIHDSSEMQFIAVTTKAGNVFYILIDYTSVQDNKSGEGTVYFLNKVDEQDLYSLINNPDKASSNIEEPGIFIDESSETAAIESALNESSITDSQTAATTNASSGSSGNSVLYIVLIIVCGGVIAAYYFLKIRPKKNAIPDDDDDFEMDDYEINEDNEQQ